MRSPSRPLACGPLGRRARACSPCSWWGTPAGVIARTRSGRRRRQRRGGGMESEGEERTEKRREGRKRRRKVAAGRRGKLRTTLALRPASRSCERLLRTPDPPAGQFAAMGASPLSVCLGPPDFFQLRAPSCLPRPPGGRIDIGCARHGHRTLCMNALRLSPPRKHPLRAACKPPCAEGRTGRRTPREQPAAAPRWISARGSRRQDRAKSGLFLFWQARRRRRDSQG